jgi:hypothetical protein
MLVPQLLPSRPPAGAAPPRKAPGAAGPAQHAAKGAADDATPFDDALLQHEQTFDLVVKLRAENEREANVLRDMAMAQLKKDDENMKKWIALI